MLQIEQLHDLLTNACKTDLAERTEPNLKEDIQHFEYKYKIAIPEDYSYILTHFGALNFGEPALYSIQELDLIYPEFLDIYQQYQAEDIDLKEQFFFHLVYLEMEI